MRVSAASRRSEKPLRLSARSRSHAERALALAAHARLLGDQVGDLRQEPGIDRRQLGDALDVPAGAERIGHVQQPVGARRAQLVDRAAVSRFLGQRQRQHRIQAVEPGLQAAQRLLQRLLEGAADRHHLADRLHLRGQAIVGGRELLEGEARDLGDHVVDGRLERRRRRAAVMSFLQLIERVADRQLGGDLGDRKAGRLRGQRRGARHARVHLDHEHAARPRD